MIFPSRHFWLICGLTASVQASPVVFDAAQGSPSDQGWHRAAIETSEEDGLEDEAWKIGSASNSANLVSYSYALTEFPLDAERWTAEASVRVLGGGRNRVKDAYLEVMDGMSQWAIGLVRVRDFQAVAFVQGDGTYQMLSEVVWGEDFDAVKVMYDPQEDVCRVFLNDTLLGKISRDQVPPLENSRQKRVAWGDQNAAAASDDDARSQTFWKTVSFQLDAE